MSRHTVIGNGNMLICFDEFGYVRDLYYPHAGLENHVVGQTHRLGISINGKFYWLKDFNIYQSQSSNTLKSTNIYKNEKEQIELEFENVVYNEKTIFLRRISVRNKSNESKAIKLYFNHEFRIKENKYRNTAFYYPHCNAVIHYRGRRVFLTNVLSEKGGISDYTVGLYDFEGKEGSYLNAEKGELSKNAVEHGPVDSVIAKDIEIPAREEAKAYYILVAGKTIDEVVEENNLLLNEKSPEHIFTTATNYWNAWKNKRPYNFIGLSEDVVKLFYRSLFVIKAHIDEEGGGIIASADSTMYSFGKDSYAYVWPRDAAYIAKAMAQVGYFNDAKKVIEFFADTMSDKGYILHKFELDKSLGSSWHSWITNGRFEIPIQEDETSIIINLLWEYYNLTKDIEFIEKYEEKLIERPADFMCDFVNKSFNLPLKSYDIWEEEYKTYTYTVCSIVDALNKASQFAEILGKNDLHKKYSKRAEELKKDLLKHLYNKEKGIFYKSVIVEEKEITSIDETIDASTLFGLWYFDILDTDSSVFTEYEKKVVDRISRKDKFFIRYENDKYFKKDHQDSNPWIITTLWHLQLKIQKTKSEEELKQIAKDFEVILKMQTESGLLPEQVDSNTLKPESATPLVWSHACYIETVAMYLRKLEEFNVCDTSLPKYTPTKP